MTQINVVGDNRPIFSVSEISQTLKRSVEENFSHVRVRGEISRFTQASSGHLYLTLKDNTSILDGVCWKGTVPRLSHMPEDGMEVIVTGRLTTYAGRSNYQIVIENLEIAGEGALLKLIEERRKKLFSEGLFDEDKKKSIPFIPNCIGLITSPTGAVIQDILRVLGDRFPSFVLLWPANVQGDLAAEQVCEGIRTFNNISPTSKLQRPDVIIVARGGGSIEDLWAFNEEIVIRAAAESNIPLISAIGHETDTTLIDFASDIRAATPSVAAEMVVPIKDELLSMILNHETRIQRTILRILEGHNKNMESLARGLYDPKRLIEEVMQRLDDRSERLINAKNNYLNGLLNLVAKISAGLISPEQQLVSKENYLESHLKAWQKSLHRFYDQKSYKLETLGLRLEAVSYQNILDRGFALIRDGRAKPIFSSKELKKGMSINITLRDGQVDATINKEKNHPINKDGDEEKN